MAWHILAWQLGWPVQLLKKFTTVTDWMKWLKFMKQEPNLFHREDWYAAKIVSTLKNLKGVSSNPKDEVMEFQWNGDKSKKRRLTVKEQKLAWAAILGNHADGIIAQIEADHKAKNKE